MSNQAGITRESSVGWMVKMLAARMDNTLAESLGTLGVTEEQFMVVMTLIEEEGVSQVEIGRRVGLPSYAMTRLLDSMEAASLLERHPDQHSRRSFSIRLTDKGKSLGPQLMQLVSEVNMQVLAPLTIAERKQLTDLLKKLAPNWNPKTEVPAKDNRTKPTG